jgi:hypothetical protein
MQQLLLDSVALYSRIRDEFTPLIERSRSVDPDYAAFAGSQMHFYSSRVQASTLLLQEWMLWDCDILMRSAIESASRFLFVSTAAEEERTLRLREFQVDLPEVHYVERAEKTRTAARHSRDHNNAALLSGATPTADQEVELRAKWPKSKRKAIKQKWSFSEIVSELERVKEPGLDLSAYGSLLHSYALGSHFVHGDSTAVDLVKDRESRNRGERDLLERAHFARLAVEPTTLLYLCLLGMSYATHKSVQTHELDAALSALDSQADTFHRAFAASQRHLYAGAESS